MNLLFSLRLPLTLARSIDPDAAIVARCQAGEVAAPQALLERHRDRVLNLAFSLLGSREDAEDAAQETFVRAFASLNGFRGEALFSTWLYRITVNICLARLRRPRPSNAYFGNNDETAFEIADGCDASRRAETTVAVQTALEQLSPPLRAVLVLREMQDLSYEEIAIVLHIPIGTVRSRLSEARRVFRRHWEES